jgi:hypothetical protein
MLGVFAELRAIIQERIRSGIACAAGKHLGRPCVDCATLPME